MYDVQFQLRFMLQLITMNELVSNNNRTTYVVVFFSIISGMLTLVYNSSYSIQIKIPKPKILFQPQS